MNVLVTPAPGPNAVWNLTDRLGRNVGRITYAPEQGLIGYTIFDR